MTFGNGVRQRTCQVQFSSVEFSCSVMSDSLRPHGLHHARPSCPSPTPRVYSNSCPLSQWCHLTILSCFIPFSSCLQSSQHQGLSNEKVASDGQSIAASVSASVLPMYIQDWFPLEPTGLISLMSKGLSRIFYNITVQKGSILQWSAFFIVQLQLSHPYIITGKTKALIRWTLLAK